MLAAAHSVCPEIHYKTSRGLKKLSSGFQVTRVTFSVLQEPDRPAGTRNFLPISSGQTLSAGLESADSVDSPLHEPQTMPALSVQSRKIMLSFFCSWELTHLNLGSSRTLLVLHPPPAPPSLKTLPLETQKRKKNHWNSYKVFTENPKAILQQVEEVFVT